MGMGTQGSVVEPGTLRVARNLLARETLGSAFWPLVVCRLNGSCIDLMPPHVERIAFGDGMRSATQTSYELHLA